MRICNYYLTKLNNQILPAGIKNDIKSLFFDIF